MSKALGSGQGEDESEVGSSILGPPREHPSIPNHRRLVNGMPTIDQGVDT